MFYIFHKIKFENFLNFLKKFLKIFEKFLRKFYINLLKLFKSFGWIKFLLYGPPNRNSGVAPEENFKKIARLTLIFSKNSEKTIVVKYVLIMPFLTLIRPIILYS